MQAKDTQAHAAGDDGALSSHDSGPSADDLRKQGAAAANRVGGSAIFGVHCLPVGTPLYIVKGKVKGYGISASVSGNAEINAEDAQHLQITLQHTNVKKGFIPISSDDTVVMSFTQQGSNEMAFSSSEDKHHKKTDSVLKLTATATANGLSFQDETTGKTGSIAWDESTQELTIKFAGDDNLLVLSPNKK
jgi:hypothetical protein